MMNEQSQEGIVRRPLTAAFRGVERDKAYGSYLVGFNNIFILVETKA